MQRYHRPILPQTESLYPRPYVEPEKLDSRRKRRRKNVRIACNACRMKKCGCDGIRPICTQCIERGTPCEYITEHLEDTPNMALKRKIEDLQQELHVQTELLNQLKSLPEKEAFQILQGLRSATSPSPESSSTLHSQNSPDTQESDDEENAPFSMDSAGVNMAFAGVNMAFMRHNQAAPQGATPLDPAFMGSHPLLTYPTNQFPVPNDEVLSYRGASLDHNASLPSSSDFSLYPGFPYSWPWPQNAPYPSQDEAEMY